MSHDNKLVDTSSLYGANYIIFDGKMTSDVDLFKAESTSQLRTSRLRHQLRQTREARTDFYRVSILSALFVFVLGANILGGTVLAVRAYNSQPARNTGVAQVILPMHDGVSCRQVLYDDKTLAPKHDRVLHCDDLASARLRGPPKPRFSWH